MAYNRILRTNEDVARTMAALLRDVKDPRVNQGMTTVTGADVTTDLKYCKLYLSVMGLTSEREFMRGLKSASGYLRRELAARLNLRATPELTFVLDHSIEHGAHINDMLSKLDITPETDPEADENDDENDGEEDDDDENDENDENDDENADG
jgi:ribosome-binding factor A